MNVYYNMVVDFARPSKTNTVLVSENDSGSRICHFTLLADKQPLDMKEVIACTLSGYLNENNTEIVYQSAIDLVRDEDGNVINELYYTIPGDITDRSGTLTMTITLIGEGGEQFPEGKRLTSFEFFLKIRNALYNEDDYVSKDEFSGFRDLLQRTQAALAQLEQNVAKDALPNITPLVIRNLDGRQEYNYIGKDGGTVEIDMGGYVAYLGDETYEVDPDDAPDLSAEHIATEAAKDARESLEKVLETKAEIDTTVGEFNQTVDTKIQEAESYATDSENYANQSQSYASDSENYYAQINNLVPRASVSKNEETGVVTFDVSDVTGSTSVDLSGGIDGKDGKDGLNGQDGQDGFSPTATVTKLGRETTITITDKNGTTTEKVLDGEGGAPFDTVSDEFEIENRNLSLSSEVTDKLDVIDDSADFLEKPNLMPSIEQGGYISGVTNPSSTRCRTSEYINVEKGKTYEVQGNLSNNKDLYATICMYDVADNRQFIDYVNWTRVPFTFSIGQNSTVKYVRIAFANGQTIESSTDIIPSEIINASLKEKTKSNVELTKDIDYAYENGFVTRNLLNGVVQGSVNGTGGIQESSNTVISQDYVSVNPNTTYTVSAEYDGKVAIYEYASQGTGKVVSSAFTEFPLTITTTSTTKYLRVLFRKTDNSDLTPSDCVRPQLEKGSKHTQYSTYTESNVSLLKRITNLDSRALTPRGGIAEGTDLDDVVVSGFYRCGSNATAETILHRPPTQGLRNGSVVGISFDLIVNCMLTGVTEPSQFRGNQILISSQLKNPSYQHDNRKIWIRSRDSDGWTTWRYILVDEDNEILPKTTREIVSEGITALVTYADVSQTASTSFTRCQVYNYGYYKVLRVKATNYSVSSTSMFKVGDIPEGFRASGTYATYCYNFANSKAFQFTVNTNSQGVLYFTFPATGTYTFDAMIMII